MANFDEIIDSSYSYNSEDVRKAIIDALAEESNKYLHLVKTNARDYKCRASGCRHNAYAKGYCNAHYMRSRNGGDMSIPVRNRTKLESCIECGAVITCKGGFGRCAKHYKARRRKIIKTEIVRLFGGKCFHCSGIFDSCVYDFHHLHSKDKDIGRLFCSGSIDKISKEVVKCILLCANCHRMEHGNG